jgi:outer membrane protein
MTYMKIVNTLLSVILLVAVIFLFTKVYDTNTTKETSTNVSEPIEPGKFQGAKIAFVDSDTLVKKYDYQQELAKGLEAKAKKVENELAIRGKAFEDNYRVLVEQSKTLSPERLQSAQAELQQMEQQIMQYREQQMALLQQEEAQLTQLMMKDVRIVLDEVKAELGVDYILSKGPGSNVMAANDEYDITPMIIERLNKAYADKQAAEEKTE